MRSQLPIDQCDVQDKEKLAVFRHFRKHWLEMLNGDDEHAIHKQLISLLDADIYFRTINYARKLCEETGTPQNGMVHLFINRGFVANQAFAIRRITEEYDGQKRKAVFSLPRIIAEIEEQREMFTREMFVCADGNAYDPAISHWETEARQRTFDELAEVTPDKRSRDDRIHPNAFHGLRKRFKSSEVFRNYANKLLAHAADPRTRSGQESFQLGKLDSAYSDLIAVTNTLSAKVLYGSSHNFLPSYTFDVIEHFEQPICPANQLPELGEFWEERYRALEMLERHANSWNAEAG